MTLLFKIKSYYTSAVCYINDTGQNTYLNCYFLLLYYFYYPILHFHIQTNLIFCIGEYFLSLGGLDP